jgi:hypothetical protein
MQVNHFYYGRVSSLKIFLVYTSVRIIKVWNISSHYRLEEMKREKCAFEEDLKSLINQSSDDKLALEENMKR